MCKNKSVYVTYIYSIWYVHFIHIPLYWECTFYLSSHGVPNTNFTPINLRYLTKLINDLKVCRKFEFIVNLWQNTSLHPNMAPSNMPTWQTAAAAAIARRPRTKRQGSSLSRFLSSCVLYNRWQVIIHLSLKHSFSITAKILPSRFQRHHFQTKSKRNYLYQLSMKRKQHMWVRTGGRKKINELFENWQLCSAWGGPDSMEPRLRLQLFSLKIRDPPWAAVANKFETVRPDCSKCTSAKDNGNKIPAQRRWPLKNLYKVRRSIVQ